MIARLTEGVDTKTTRITRSTARGQREASPSSQLQGSPSMNHGDTAQSQPGGGKRRRITGSSQATSITKTTSQQLIPIVISDSEEERFEPNFAKLNTPDHAASKEHRSTGKNIIASPQLIQDEIPKIPSRSDNDDCSTKSRMERFKVSLSPHHTI